MVSRRAPIAVVVLAPARALASLRALVAELGPPFARSTLVERLRGAIAAEVAAARAATPSRGVVVVVASESDVEAQLAAGADEAIVEPVDGAALSRALRRASLRASVRDEHAIEARTLEQVLEGVAHAAEAPLAALALDLDAMRSGEPETIDELDAALDDCSTAVEHLAQLVRDAIVLARAARDQPSEPVDVPPLIEQVLRALGGDSALLAHVEVHRDDVLPIVVAPRRLFARTLAQVIVQALDAMPPEPPPSLRRLRITVREAPAAVAIVIEARASLDAEPASTRLTLSSEGRVAVARAAMRSFDGELIAERAVDGGVRFVAFVPRAAGAERALPTSAAVRTERPRARPRVLVVDGDPRVLRAATRALSDRYDVVVAVSGDEALALIREERIDAALIDARLSDVTTAALLAEVRDANAALASRVVLACRSREDAADSAGARVMEKPIRRAALIAIMDELLGRSDAHTSSTTPRLLN